MEHIMASGRRDKTDKIPSILVIGAGRFGQKHIRVLKNLEAEGKLTVAGVVVRDTKKHKDIGSKFGVTIYSEATSALLKTVDAVDIVTPPETHFDIVKKCLPYTNVFVEKPLAMNAKDSADLQKAATKHKRLLVVGHVFRYHPVAEKLKFLLDDKEMPRKISGAFINPVSSDQGREASLELLHLFDVVDFLWEKNPTNVSVRKDGRVSTVDIRYGKKQDARFTLGWRSDEKSRTLTFSYPELVVEADFSANTIVFVKNGKREMHSFQMTQEPLYKEISDVVAVLIKGSLHQHNQMTGGKTAGRIVSIAERAISKANPMPTVAVVGGGIFGTSIAAELGSFCKVTLFEKNSEFMREASLVNQFRHHYGYHYPRSDETVVDIQTSRADFEKIFSGALLAKYPTYYALAKTGSLVTLKEFLAFCKRNNLPYEKKFPAAGILSKKEIELCIQVPEPSYHHAELMKITKKRLASLPHISVLYNTIVTDCSILDDSEKEISYATKGKKVQKKKFDFIVNATYANINALASWLNFEHYPIRVDLAEVLIVNLPIDPVSLTVIDGPFATLMPTGNKNEFTLYHVKESIIDRYVPENGLVRKQKKIKSNAAAIFSESLKLFPILKDAKIIESRIVHRGVRAHHEHSDARIADIIEHGFGCWSVLSGKILSSVRTGKRVANIIKKTI